MNWSVSMVGYILITVVISEIRGFLFRSCPDLSTCSLQCPNGYYKSTSGTTFGCDLCQCAIHSSSSSSAFTDYTHPCVSQPQYCNLKCPNGYVTGSAGCQYCLCKSVATTLPTSINPLLKFSRTTPTTTIATTTMHISIQLSNPCIVVQHFCDRICNNGYLLGPSNCQYCICRPPGMRYTTAIPTTTVSTTPMAVYLPNPCVAGKHICEGTRCKDGFIKGPNNCQYCMCAPPTTAPPVNSSQPQHQHGYDSHTTTILPGHMVNECHVAWTICQLKCKNGFMADTVDCKYCICKDEIYRNAGIAKGDEPTIQLMNPCVKGVDICNIFCSHGYLRGPQQCQYCACGPRQF